MQMQCCPPQKYRFLSFFDNFIAFDLMALEASDVSHVQSFTLVITETDWYFMNRWIFKKGRK